MKCFFLFLIALLPYISSAQIQGEDEVHLNGDRIEAKFNHGGMEEFNKFVNENFDNSKVTQSGKMIAAFKIDIDGDVKNIKIIKMIDSQSAIEMIRVLKLSPKWQPASRGGKPISIEIKYPIVFNKSEKQQSESFNQEKESTANDALPNATKDAVKVASVETKPQFPGGAEAFYIFVAKKFKVPSDRAFKGGKMVISFVVEKDGSLSEMKAIQDIGFGTTEEAFRILANCPKWSPALQNGKPVRVQYSLPITLMP